MVTGAPDAPPPAGETTRGRQRWRGPVLFASLVLNLFLIGLMVGGWAHHRHGPGWLFGMHGERGASRMAGSPGGLRGSGGPPIRHAVQSLPEADQQVFKEIMGALRPEIRKEQQELRRLRQRAGEAVRAGSFDRNGFLAAMSEIRQKQVGIQERLHTGTADALAKLSVDSRRQFADQFTPRPRP